MATGATDVEDASEGEEEADSRKRGRESQSSYGWHGHSWLIVADQSGDIESKEEVEMQRTMARRKVTGFENWNGFVRTKNFL